MASSRTSLNARLAGLKNATEHDETRRKVEALARTQLDFTQAGRLDRFMQKFAEQHTAPEHPFPVCVALLTSCTVQHLLRIAALPFGLRLEIYTDADGSVSLESCGVRLHPREA